MTPRRCDGCGGPRLDLECGRPARATHLPLRSWLCADCRAYIVRVYGDQWLELDEPAWRPISESVSVPGTVTAATPWGDCGPGRTSDENLRYRLRPVDV
jgi:hypothetical protein